jgi:predicted ATPase/DNA-binding CsgD family transcriptional regulator
MAASRPRLQKYFFGREQACTDVLALLKREDVALVVLTGPGGVGKTQLALHVADAIIRSTGVNARFVDLSAVRHDGQVASEIARGLAVRVLDERRIVETVARTALANPQQFLILDNLEQVIEGAAGFIAQLLDACPTATILATSRRPLRLREEFVVPVLPLAVPIAGEPISAEAAICYPAVQLFVARSQQQDPSFVFDDDRAADVVAICAGVDGIPLAIELAAAQSPLLSLTDIRCGIDLGAPALSSGFREVPARQQTMDATLSWSFQLLSESSRTLLTKLAVFAHGFSLEAARAVAGPSFDQIGFQNAMQELCEQSLVTPLHAESGESRYRLLEPVRQFAQAHLDISGERPETLERHARFFYAFVERLDLTRAHFRPDRFERLMLADAFQNVEIAMETLRDLGETAALIDLILWLHFYSFDLGRVGDRARWLELGDAWTQGRVDAQRAKVLIGMASQQNLAGHIAQAVELATEALAIMRDSGDRWFEADAAARTGIYAGRLGEHDLAIQHEEHALAIAQQLGSDHWVLNFTSTVLGHLGNITLLLGEIERAGQYFSDAVLMQRNQGFEPGASHRWGNHPVAGLGDVARARGDPAVAYQHYLDACTHAHQFRDARGVAFALSGIAGSLAAMGEWRLAARSFGRAEAYHDAISLPFGLESMDRQRALGLPEPWQRASEPFGKESRLREAVLRGGHSTHRSIPDVSGAESAWAEGRMVPIPQLLIELNERHPSSMTSSAAHKTDPFTPREIEVLRLLAEGRSDKEIAVTLFVSPRTASSHVANILMKLDVSSRAAAATWAAKNDYV